MKKVRFGCDVDGVIYRFADTANYLLKTHFGYDIGEWKNWDWAEKFVSHKAWMWLWSAGITRHGLFRYGSIYKGAREFLQRIQTKCDVVVITSRPPLAVADTMEWLAYQRFPTDEIHIVRTRNKQKKSDIIPHCDIYLDDGAHNIADVLTYTKALCLLMDRPWNQDFGPGSEETIDGTMWERFKRVKSWAEVEEEIEKVYVRVNG